MSILIKNAQLVAGQLVNIFIKDQVIFDIGAKTPLADQTIDAAGQFVIPGMIDPHVHFRTPGQEYKEDWVSGSRAAVAGGVTTVLDMPNNQPSITSQALVEEKRRLIAGKSLVNFELYIGATASNLEELRSAQNVAGIKIYLGSTTGDLLLTDYDVVESIMRECSQLIAFHSEELGIRNKELRIKNKESIVELHNQSRPPECALESTRKIIELVRKTKRPAYICHVSTAEEIELIRQAKVEKLPVYLEIAPHHLFLDTESASELGNFAKVNPPIRTPTDRAACFAAVNSGLADTIGSDHAPHTMAEKALPYEQSPAGIPGVETSRPLLLNAVCRGELTLERVVEITATNPARIFHLERRGAIAPGFFADLVIVNLNLTSRVKNSKLNTKCGWSPFDGWKLKGAIVATIVNGRIVFKKELS